jgi:hypothetical protein
MENKGLLIGALAVKLNRQTVRCALLSGVVIACSSTPDPAPPAQRAKPPLAVPAANVTEPVAPHADPRTGALAALAATLPGAPRSSLLLLGLHVEAVESYRALFSAEGVPKVDEGAGYVTLVIRVDEGGQATVSQRLPFVAVPRVPGGTVPAGGSSFRLIGEASYSEDLTPTAGFADDPPPFYASTELVSADHPAALRKEVSNAVGLQKATRAWGQTHAQTLLFATPLAMCTLQSDSEWTGGALAFRGWDQTELSSLAGAKLDPRATAYVPDDSLKAFARAALAAREEEPAGEIDLDAKVDLFFREIHFRRDTSVCLGRAEGATVLMGSIVLPGNSARTYAWVHPLGPAPSTLAWPEEPIDFGLVRASFADARDAFVAPGRSAAIVVRDSVLTSFTAPDRASNLGIALPPDARVVLAVWAKDGDVDRWADELRALERL